jgi:hypothetical protein
MISDVASNHNEIINHLKVDNQPYYGGLNHEIGYCNLRIQLAVFLLSLLKHGPRLSKAGVFSYRVSRRRHISSR